MTSRPLLPFHQRRLSLILAIVLVVLLFYLGAQPFAAGLLPGPSDKLAHFAFFVVLTTLLCLGMTERHPVALIALASIIGIADEVHQLDVPGRSANFGDLLTDITGAVVAVAIFEYLRARGAAKRRVRG